MRKFKDYSKYEKELVLKLLDDSYSVEEFMNKSGIKSLDKNNPRKRFDEFFGISLRQIIDQNKKRKKEQEQQEKNNRLVECDYCHNMFRYGDHPSHNKKNHNFCCNEHKNLYIASFSKGKTKTCKCKDCGTEIVVDIHAAPEYSFCHDCLNKHDYSKPKEKRPKRGKRYCENCGKELNPSAKRFCSVECDNEHRYKDYIKRWKLGLEDGMSGVLQISKHIRRYIFKKYGSKCARCGWCEINPTSGKIPLEIEHIDGNYKNNTEENLILLCPNCHSLTPTYKALNKGHGRKERYKK